MSPNQRIADDLGRKLGERLQEILQCETDIALTVLPHTDVVAMLMKTAAGIQVAAILAALQVRKDGTDAAEMFDSFNGFISHGLIPALKPMAMATIEVIEQTRSERASA